MKSLRGEKHRRVADHLTEWSYLPRTRTRKLPRVRVAPLEILGLNPKLYPYPELEGGRLNAKF